MKELEAFAKGRGFQRKIELWDVTYWSERLREASYEFEEEQLRAYFSLPKVCSAISKIHMYIYEYIYIYVYVYT
jgi:oligopeptidase A